MTAQVVADARFLTPERLLELREHGDVEVSLQSVLGDLELGEPQGTEVVVGTLTVEEARLFTQLYAANLDMEDMARDTVGRQLTQLGETLRQSDRSKSLSDVLRASKLSLDEETVPDADAKTFFRTNQRRQMLHACFYYHVGERLDLHEWRLGVRSKGRIVRIEKR